MRRTMTALLGLGFMISFSGVAGAEALVKVNGKPLSQSDMDAEGKARLARAEGECYEKRKGAVDEFLFGYLVDLEAKKAGTSAEKLQEAEIKNKARKVSDREIKDFYDKFEAQAKMQGKQVPPLNQLSDRIREKLQNDNRGDRQMEYFAELKKRYKVAYAFQRTDAVKIDVGSLPVKGPASAPVTIVEFSDFECPFCKRGFETVQRVAKEYRGQVKIYFRDFPLGFHQRARPAAMAARCAGEQGQFWPYHDRLFAEQKLDDAQFLTYAKELKLDTTKFEACLKSNKHMPAIDADMQAGSAVGVTGTPAFFINGIMLSGARPFSDFKEIIDEILAASGTAKPKSAASVMP